MRVFTFFLYLCQVKLYLSINIGKQKAPVPPAVEHVARRHNESVLQLQLVLRLADEAVEDKPIEQKHYRKKNCKLNRVEEQLLTFIFYLLTTYAPCG